MSNNVYDNFCDDKLSGPTVSVSRNARTRVKTSTEQDPEFGNKKNFF